ncbi:hypothetical protein [Microbulbifer elongatus]|uniref:hypothetical protein n=1 Tax=Microbulbifer elongatus TaxID=86173 RepID=UPI001CFDA0D3|nr:hypothetical protein [Microbulbifer elongatus]
MVDKVETITPVSRPAAVLILSIFLAVAVVCMLLPVASFLEMAGQISGTADAVLINKGVFYLFGVGVALSGLLVDGSYNALLHRPVPESLKRQMGKVIFLGLVLVVILPSAIHYISAYVLELRGYIVCESASSQWLFVRDIVYTLPDACN